MISRDVVFEESKGWNWNEKQILPFLQGHISTEKDNNDEEANVEVHADGGNNSNGETYEITHSDSSKEKSDNLSHRKKTSCVE